RGRREAARTVPDAGTWSCTGRSYRLVPFDGIGSFCPKDIRFAIESHYRGANIHKKTLTCQVTIVLCRLGRAGPSKMPACHTAKRMCWCTSRWADFCLEKRFLQVVMIEPHH